MLKNKQRHRPDKVTIKDLAFCSQNTSHHRVQSHPYLDAKYFKIIEWFGLEETFKHH